MTWSVSIGPGAPGDEEKIDEHLGDCELASVAFEIGASRFLLAKDSGKIVGCGALQPIAEFAFLRALAVHPSSCHRGLGRQLVRELIDRALRFEAETIFLLTIDKAEFFGRMGFRRIDRGDAPASVLESEHFRSRACADATLMSFVFPQGRVDS